jgi:streptomycin 6-kinase
MDDPRNTRWQPAHRQILNRLSRPSRSVKGSRAHGNRRHLSSRCTSPKAGRIPSPGPVRFVRWPPSCACQPTSRPRQTWAARPGIEWLEALPDQVEELTARWGLRIGEPFEPGGNCSWVAPGVDSEGREVVLKVAWQHTEALHEAEGPAALGGQGAVEVYTFEHLAPTRPGGRPDGDAGGTTAMLLERCRPGTELRGRPEAEQHVVVTDLLRSVWAVNLPSGHPFRPLSIMADDWVSEAEERLDLITGPFDRGLARHGLELFRELARTGPTDVLLFTDLHAGNVLAGQRLPWLFIDPKPYVGDPHYDVLQHLLNCTESLQADPIGLLTEVADLAALDSRRVRQWLFARCIQESLNEGWFAAASAVALDRLGDP